MRHVHREQLRLPDLFFQEEDGGAPIPERHRITIWTDSEGRPLTGYLETYWNAKRLSCSVSDAEPEESGSGMFLRLSLQARLEPHRGPFS
jgi:hypothetical protein